MTNHAADIAHGLSEEFESLEHPGGRAYRELEDWLRKGDAHYTVAIIGVVRHLVELVPLAAIAWKTCPITLSVSDKKES